MVVTFKHKGLDLFLSFDIIDIQYSKNGYYEIISVDGVF